MTKTAKAVLLGVVGLVGVCVLGVVGLGVWFFTSAIESVPADETQAARSFADVRAKFGDRAPLLEVTDRGSVRAERAPGTTAGGEIQTVRMIAWDAGDRKLASVSLPFWLLRMSDGPINVSATSATNARLSMTAAELERYGPTLLIDDQDEDGSRVLVWTE